MLALDLLKRLDRTTAAMSLLLGLACALGTVPAAIMAGRQDPLVRTLLLATGVLILVLTLAGAALLWYAGERAVRGEGRWLHTALGALSLTSNPPLGTAYGLFALWTCWSHPAAAARLAGREHTADDPAADDRARRYHRLARGLVVGFGLFYSLLGGGLMAGLGPLLAWGGQEPEVTVTADAVSFEGMYGEHIERGDIEQIQLRDELPTITLRTNGYALGSTLKGWFQTREHGKVKLLLRTDQPPWIYLYRDGGLLIYGSVEPQRTEQLYRELGGS